MLKKVQNFVIYLNKAEIFSIFSISALLMPRLAWRPKTLLSVTVSLTNLSKAPFEMFLGHSMTTSQTCTSPTWPLNMINQINLLFKDKCCFQILMCCWWKIYLQVVLSGWSAAVHLVAIILKRSNVHISGYECLTSQLLLFRRIKLRAGICRHVLSARCI